MALNVEQITARLAQMPDAALQKYAAMNKNDPYIMALAVSESNRRKQMRQAAQGAQGQIPQPKVVDAAVQGMAAPMPEEMGIARLPAGDMNFADGGIVAFADGGDVEHYADMGFTGFSFGDWATADKERRRKKLEEERAANMAAVARGSTYSPEAYGVETPAPLFQDPRLLGAAPGMPPRTPPAGNQPPAPPAPAAKTDTAPRAPGAAPAQAPTPGLPGIQDLAKLRADIYGKQKFEDPAKAEVEALGQEGIAGAQRRQKSFEDFIAKQGDVYKAREERLAKRERDVEGMRNQELGLALFLGGATAAGTVGSIGKAFSAGATAGGQQYAQGIARIRAAQERLADARDKMEELRLNRDDLTFKQRTALEADIDKAKIDAKRLSIDGIRMAADVNEKRAADIFGKSVDLAKTQFEQSEATKRSNAQVSATLSSPERLVFNALLQKHKGDAAAAYSELVSTKREPISREAALKNWTTNQMMITAQNPSIKTFEDYYAQLSGGAGGGDGFRVVGVR